MKIQFGAVLLATLVLAGCQSPPKAADANSQPAAVATSDTKKCDVVTGSRMGNCHDQGAPEVQAQTGDDFRRSGSALSRAAPQSPF